MEIWNEKITELLALMTQRPNLTQILLSLLVALGFTLWLWLCYRLANHASTYRPQFAATLVSLALISTILMDLIQSNLALSLGMLGSLSIVRFRTNIHDPRDIGFIFWSMAIGLAAATESYLLGLVGSLVLGLFLIFSGRSSTAPNEMMLVVRGSDTDLNAVACLLASSCDRHQLKAKNVMTDSFELVYEVQLPGSNSDTLIRRIFDLGGVDSVNLLAQTNAGA